MNILIIMIPISLLFGLSFVGAFIFLVRKGQYDDLDTPPHRILYDDEISQERKS